MTTITFLPASHGLSGKGVATSTLWLRDSKSERTSSHPRSHSGGWLPRALAVASPTPVAGLSSRAVCSRAHLLPPAACSQASPLELLSGGLQEGVV